MPSLLHAGQFVSAMRGKVSLPFMLTPPPIQVANLGMADSLILMVLALVVFGPRRLPQIGRQIGKLMYEFRKASNDFKFQMEEELRNADEADRRKAEEERLRALALAAPAPPAGADTVSHVPESGPGAPAMEATTATAESPYPDENQYPDLSNPTPEPQPEESYPRIQPPTTGEQVPAVRPATLPAQEEAAEESGSAASLDSNPEAAPEPGAVADPVLAEQPTPTPEPVNHHG
jgi:sec-independent protein translocase protein TatB